MTNQVDLSGKKFGRLLVVSLDATKSDERWWTCMCECGRRKSARGYSLTRGRVRSCGCLSREMTSLRSRQREEKLGGFRKDHPLYHIWKSMRRRCQNPNHKDYFYYGARGITFDVRWNDFEVFINEVGERPSRLHTLDRIDNDGDYIKENVRWATRREQLSNRREITHCRNGHPWSEENTIWTHNGTGPCRRCRACQKTKGHKTDGQ